MSLFYGLLSNMPWWGYIIVTLIMTHITMVSVTVFLHRSQAHRAIELHPIMMHFFRFWLWFTTGMKTKEWVSVHRKHHARCETEEDPHSPVIEGINTVLWQGAELYRHSKKDPETLEKYGKGTPSDWLEKYVYSAKFMRGKQGIVALLLIQLVLFGAPGIVMWGVEMAWTPFFAAGVINGVGHYFGYRNFECPDASRNILPWGILIAGEELHNNHHTYGNSAKLSVKWWEFDIGWMYIRMMQALGLAKPKRTPPIQDAPVPAEEMDLDTIQDVINNKVSIFTHYSEDVLMPLFKCEKQNLVNRDAVAAFSSATRRAIKRHPATLKNEEQENIDQALTHSKPLHQAYHARNSLNEVWSKTYKNNHELIKSFQEWCHHAEKSGIHALQKFARHLKSYRLKPHHGKKS
jgi:stearoyl-CoA desaturase (delta-9 desaturase)